MSPVNTEVAGSIVLRSIRKKNNGRAQVWEAEPVFSSPLVVAVEPHVQFEDALVFRGQR